MNNTEHEERALNFVKYFTIVGWCISALAFFLWIMELAESSYESQPVFYFVIFIAWTFYMWSLSFIFQIFFYLKGIYEELRKDNSINSEQRTKRNF